jgi:uncharacterized protein YoxC
MAGEFNAGAIFVSLKAQVDGLQKGVKAAKETLDKLGVGAKESSEKVRQGGEKIARTFDQLDRQQVRMAASFAKFTNRLLGLQFALSSFQQIAGDKLTGFRKTVDSVSTGLTTFAGIVSVFPNKIGVVVGAVAGLGAALKGVSDEIATIAKRSEDLGKRIKANFANILAAGGKQDLAAALSPNATLEHQVNLKARAAEREFTQMRRIEDQINALEQRKIDAREERNRKLLELLRQQTQIEDAIRRERLGGNFDTAAFDRQLAAIKRQIEDLNKLTSEEDEGIPKLEKQLSGARDRANGLVVELQDLGKALDHRESLDAYTKAMRELSKEMATINELLAMGVIDGPEATKRRLDIASRQVRTMVENRELLSIAPETGGHFSRALGDANRRRLSLEADKALDDILALEQKQGSNKKNEDEAIDRVQRMAVSFSHAIGAGIQQGILSGQSAMETLAGVGRNLFENMINETILQFEEGMAGVFKDITGVAGEGIANLLTGVAGLAGMLLSKKQSKNQSFSSIQSQVNSTQAVRGVVAGPQSVAIAAVGQDIARAMVPVTERLDVVITELRGIRGRMGTGAAGGLGFVGVPTA